MNILCQKQTKAGFDPIINGYKPLQVHFDGVDRKTHIDFDGYWGFGIYIDRAKNKALIRTNSGSLIAYYFANYSDLLEYYMKIIDRDIPAHLCTVKYPWDILARRA